MLLCSRSITYPIIHWLLCSLVLHLDICRALGLKELHAQSHLEECHKSKHLQDLVGKNKTVMVITLTTPSAGSMEKCSVIVTEDRIKSWSVLPTHLFPWETAHIQCVYQSTRKFLTNFCNLTGTQEKVAGFQDTIKRKNSPLLHTYWGLTRRQLLTVIINYMTWQTNQSSSHSVISESTRRSL